MLLLSREVFFVKAPRLFAVCPASGCRVCTIPYPIVLHTTRPKKYLTSICTPPL